MTKFYSVIHASSLTGYSRRQFERLSVESGNPGINFGRGKSKHFKWTGAMVESIIRYANAPKVKYPRRNLCYPRLINNHFVKSNRLTSATN
jgi:hypothetical protein